MKRKSLSYPLSIHQVYSDFFNISPECFYILFLLTEGLILRFTYFFFLIDVLDSYSHGKCKTLILV